MKHQKLNQSGHLHILIALVVVLAVGAIGTYVYSTSHAATPAAKLIDEEGPYETDANKIAPLVSPTAQSEYVLRTNPAKATTSSSRKVPRINSVDKFRYASITYSFWSRKYSWAKDRSTWSCRPLDVRFKYYNRVNDAVFRGKRATSIAYSGVGAAAKFWRSTPGYCVTEINVNSRAYNKLHGKKAALCETLVHEYGHLLGFKHTRSRKSIMAPSTLRTIDLKACQREFGNERL